MMTELSHVSVLSAEVLAYAEPVCKRPGSLVIDCTLGLGGHSEALLEHFPEIQVIGLDKDASLLTEVSERLATKYPARFIAYNLCFSDLSKVRGFDDEIVKRADYILADLGISSVQLDSEERGFSFRLDAPLDMRMDTRQALTADKILNSWDERKLFLVFVEGGVGSFSKALAREVVKRRPLLSTKEFAEVCQEVFHRDKRRSQGGAHPATVPFQAVRIAVNEEYSALKKLLAHSISILSDQGRCAVISFHSLEDKLVANAMRWWGSTRARGLHPEDAPLGGLLTKKAVTPKEDEMTQNPRSRSARLRVFERNQILLWRERPLLN